jgi:ketosteroid isomerase-like protein
MNMIKQKRGFVGLMVIAFCLFVFTPIVLAGPIEESVQMSREWAKAFNEGNAEVLSALYTSDAFYTSWASPFPTEGRNALRAMFAGFFRAYPTRFIAIRDVSRRAYGDTVIYNSDWSLIYVDAKGTMKTIFGRSSSTSIVIEGRRLIVDHSSSFFPTAGP